jgi:anti-sigma B factor antagonist
MALVFGDGPNVTGVEGFAVRVQPDREVVHVAPVGELDLATVPELREAVHELIEAGIEHVVVDLRGLSFMDVAGVGLLLALTAGALRDGWSLSLIPGPRVLQRIFALTDTLERLPFVAARAIAA